MVSDQQIEQLFADIRARVTEATAGSDTQTSRGTLGCALVFVPTAAFATLAILYLRPQFVRPSWFEWLLAASFVIAAICVPVGVRLSNRSSSASTAVATAGDQLRIPALVEMLVPGGRLSYPRVATPRYHASLLLEPENAASSSQYATLEGRIAGLAAVLEEVPGDFDSNIASGWHFRFELPFAVNGHLRIRVPRTFEAQIWKRGFERMEDATQRLGTKHVIDVAPRGSGPEPEPGADTAGLHPDVLLTQPLFERLRESADISVAAAGRTLWVMMPRHVRPFESHIGMPDDLAAWKKAARAFDEVEGIVRAVVAPLAPR